MRLAIVRPLPRSFLSALKKNTPGEPIDWERAHQQHETYARIVAQAVPHVITIPADESFPDCCFIEDTAVVSGSDIVITRIGAESRRGESEAVAEEIAKLAREGYSPRIHRITSPATMDGGDVLQMGDHIFVGLSERTNAEAVRQLQTFLPKRKVTSLPVADGLHLKSVLSAFSDEILLAADSSPARLMAQAIMDALGAKARCVYLPDTIAANVVRLDKTVLIQAGFPKSEAILRSLAGEEGLRVECLAMSELIKADGALSCCSLLIPR